MQHIQLSRSSEDQHGPKRVTVEFYGEHDPETLLLTGIWVSFVGSWRPPSLWRDIGGLIQTLNEFRKHCPEFTRGSIDVLQRDHAAVRPRSALPPQPLRRHSWPYLVRHGHVQKGHARRSYAPAADTLYASPHGISALTAWYGILAYAMQLYFDFSGYSDMALGLARMFSIEFLCHRDLPLLPVLGAFLNRHLACGDAQGLCVCWVCVEMSGGRMGCSVV
jgi:hypothetical protein